MASYPFTGYGASYGASYATNYSQNPYFQNALYQPPLSQIQQAQQQSQQGPHMEIPRVSGKESIFAYPMGPDSSAIFVSSDPNSDLGWIVTTDSAAYKTITPCHITPDVEEKPVKASDLEERFAQIESRFNDLEKRMNTSNVQLANKSFESNTNGTNGTGGTNNTSKYESGGKSSK